MEESLAIGLAGIVVFGVSAQWIASRLRIPSILVLLGAGVIAGPVTGIVKPDELFGEALFPIVSLAVGLLLFEGGLSLRIQGFKKLPSTVVRLVTVGAVVTWLIAAAAAALLFDLSTEITLLLGAILIVSGPTVIIPLLRQVRPRSPIAETLRWEGIVIDPIGAAVAVLVLNVAVEHEAAWTAIALELFLTTTVGIAIGLLAAAALTYAIVKFHITDHLINSVAILFAVISFTAANEIVDEAGLFATTTLGIALANQRYARTATISHFQEELGPLILAGLFVILGAQVELGSVLDVAVASAVLTLVLVLIARPVVVWLSTVRSGLPWQQRVYLAALAPRGIVAASVASLFALKLESAGLEADELVPITFSVIFMTVLVSSVVAIPLAHRLGISLPPRNGLVLVGDHEWLLDLAREVGELGVPTVVASTELQDDGDLPDSVELFTEQTSSEEFLDLLEQRGISDAVVAFADPERAAYAAGRLVGSLGRRHVFRMPKQPVDDSATPKILGQPGRIAFADGLSQYEVHDVLHDGGVFERSLIDADQPTPEGSVSLISVDPSGALRIEHGPTTSNTAGHVVTLLQAQDRELVSA